MRYAFSEDQRLLQTSVEKFLAIESEKRGRRPPARSPEFDQDQWMRLADMGLTALPFDEKHGGAGCGPLETLIVMEAFGRACFTAPYFSAIVLAGGVLRHCAKEPQKAKLIPQIASGTRRLAFAFAEAQARFNIANVATSAEADGDDFVINGSKIAVYGAPDAHALLVTARTGGAQGERGGVSLFLAPIDTPGLSLRSYSTIDGFRAANVEFNNVALPSSALIGGRGEALEGVERALNAAIGASCAEAVGAMEALNEKTLEHCKTRIAFGQPISKFQVVQHRLVDMHIAYEYAAAMTLKLHEALARGGAVEDALISAVSYEVGEDGDAVGRGAIQLHGAIGITEELDVGRYFKRLVCLRNFFGTPEHHLRRYASIRQTENWSEPGDLNLSLSEQDRAFQQEVREFLEDNLTPDLREAARRTLWAFAEFEYGVQWQKILNAKGWGAPDWPVEYGGAGWSPTQRMIWAIENARAGAPEVMRQGKNFVGPCVIHYGTDRQKAEILPRILAGEDWWAQGYSEPQAGSDLAALQLSARADGDDYVLNGSKIWTTFAHKANKMFCLARTSKGEKKSAGITFLLIDLDTPGIEIRPIINIAGDHEFNEVFFTDVRVAKTCRLGDEGDGWRVGRHLLRFEHSGLLVQAAIDNRRRFFSVVNAAREEADGVGGVLLDDPDFNRQLAQAEIGFQAIEFAAQQVLAKREAAVPLPTVSELLNLRNRELAQRLTRLGVEAVGYHAIPFQIEATKVGANVAPVGPLHALLATPLYLSQLALTIAGGTAEIHRNNLARNHLSL